MTYLSTNSVEVNDRVDAGGHAVNGHTLVLPVDVVVQCSLNVRKIKMKANTFRSKVLQIMLPMFTNLIITGKMI